MKTFAKVHDQNLLQATLLKAVFLLPEEFQWDFFAEIYYEYSRQLFQLLGKKMVVYSSTLDTNSTWASSSS